MILGELIVNLHRPDVAMAVLTSLDQKLVDEIERRAAMATMTPANFVAGAVREFVDRGNDDLWFQLVTVMRQAEDPSLQAIRAILQWVVASDEGSS